MEGAVLDKSTILHTCYDRAMDYIKTTDEVSVMMSTTLERHYKGVASKRSKPIPRYRLLAITGLGDKVIFVTKNAPGLPRTFRRAFDRQTLKKPTDNDDKYLIDVAHSSTNSGYCDSASVITCDTGIRATARKEPICIDFYRRKNIVIKYWHRKA